MTKPSKSFRPSPTDRRRHEVARGRRRGRTRPPGLEGLECRTLLSAVDLPEHVPQQVLVQFRPGAGEAAMADALGGVGGGVVERLRTAAMRAAGSGQLDLVAVPEGLDVTEAIRRLGDHPAVAFAEPNFVYRHAATSNDPYYTDGSLYGMYGDATTPANQFGSQAGEAWAAGNVGSNAVYVGVIDEGIQFTHPDLDANVWTNPFDPVGGGDDDGNGFIDDTHGWDFVTGDNTIYDGTGDDHGTHVTGTIAAEGGNGIGVVGVNWNVTYISGKFLGAAGGTTANAVRAVDYFTDLKTRHGLNIVATNNSWGGGGFSQSLLDAITRGANQNILFIAAAGNNSSNNDSIASYPSNYNTTSGAGYDAVIAVAAIGSTGGLASFSNFGATQVDLGAPGVGVWSTVPNNTYASYSGTSMATPHVTGAAALYAAVNPGSTALQIRNAILGSVIATSSLSGKTVTGGRLNVSGFVGGPVAPSFSVNDVSQLESGTFSFTVTRSGDTSAAVGVSYATANGSATAPADYTAIPTTVLNFAVGETTKTVTVAVVNDATDEPDETFTVNLSGATGASITDAQGVGTIRNDDAAPPPPLSFAINDVSELEGRSGRTNFRFTVTRAGSTSSAVSVSFATANGSATAGSDYTAISGTVSFAAGETTKTVTVSVKGDRTAELDEEFFVNLSNPTGGATLADGQGLGTIRNDDGPIGSGAGRAAGAESGSATAGATTLIVPLGDPGTFGIGAATDDDLGSTATRPARRRPSPRGPVALFG